MVCEHPDWTLLLKARKKDIFKVSEFGENISYPVLQFHKVRNSTMAFSGVTSFHILSETIVIETGK